MSKTRLTEMQGAIIRLLGEAGSEGLAATANTLYRKNAANPPGDFLPVFLQELAGLIQMRALKILLTTTTRAGATNEIDATDDEVQVVLSPNAGLAWDGSKKYFRWVSPWGDACRVELVLLEMGFRILRD